MSAPCAAPQPVAPTLQFPEWQREYSEALFEINPARLAQRLRIAEFVLAGDWVVCKKIEAALSKLRLLKNLSCNEEAA